MSGADEHRASERWVATAGIAALVLVVVGCLGALALPVPRGVDAPVHEFSADRALTHVDALATSPRPPSSPGHARGREYLVAELTAQGWITEVQRAVGATDRGAPGVQPVGAVANVVATLPGTGPTGTVLLVAHYDTVAGSPGAGDDGLGVATVLETARALTTDGPVRNDLVVLLTDGEENGLLGAEAFVRERATRLGTTVVLNHEARGVSGSPVTFRTSEPNSTLLAVLARAPGASADSAAEAVFDALPNDTDFTPLRAAGLHGYDAAITSGGAYYHSPLDDRHHLDPASLQRMGTTTLSAARELAGRQLADVPAGRDDIVLTVPWGLVRYPQALELPLAIAALVPTGAVVALGRRRRKLTIPRTALSIVVAFVVIAGAVLGGFAVWQAALTIDPGQASAVVGEPYRPVPYQVAVLLAGLGSSLALLAVARRLGAAALTGGALLALGLLGCLLAVVFPGTSTALVPPTLFAALGVLVAALLADRSPAVRAAVVTLALVPGAVLIGPAVWTGFELGLNQGGGGSALFLAVLVVLALPLLAAAMPSARVTGSVGIAALLLAVAATGVGLHANREGTGDPRQEMVRYALDADTGEAFWVSPVPPRSGWSRTLLPRPPATLDAIDPWTDGDPLFHGPAPTTTLAPPDVTVVSDTVQGDIRELTLRVSSCRGAPSLGLWVGAATPVRRMVVAGRDIPLRGPRGPWSTGVVFHGAPVDGVRIRLDVPATGGGVELRVSDRSDDLAAAPPLPAFPVERVLTTPQVIVSRAVTV